MVTPVAKRQAVAHLVEAHKMSERRACRVLGCCRMTMRYEVVRQDDPVLRERLKELAKARRRFGYRRLHVFLRREGHAVNHKRLFRIYREEQLHVRRSGGRKRAMGTRAPMVLPLLPNQRWSLDLVSDQMGKTRYSLQSPMFLAVQSPQVDRRLHWPPSLIFSGFLSTIEPAWPHWLFYPHLVNLPSG